MNAPGAPLVSVKDVQMAFGRTVALGGVDLTLRAGEIHGLVGPNGSGKSTLIKILAGVYSPDAGEVKVDGHDLKPGGDPALGFIHQNLGLVNALTVRENMRLTLGPINRFGGLLNHRAERRAARAALGRVHLDIDPETHLTELTLGERTLVAVARLLELGAHVLVCDEATAALTPSDANLLHKHLREEAEQGNAVMIVSHRLSEIVEQCDSVTCLRDGKIVHSGETPSLERLHLLIAGPRVKAEEAADVAVARSGPATEPVLEARDASYVAKDGKRVGPVNLVVEPGDAIALIGPLSSGLYDVARLLSGHLPATEGSVVVNAGDGATGVVGLVPEDRESQGLLPGQEISANMILSALDRFTGWTGRVRSREVATAVDGKIEELQIKPDDRNAIVHTLSGGNQQKVLIGRVSLQQPDVYVLCEPSRGVDVGAREAIHEFIRAERRRGAAAIIVTTDADEALETCEKIAPVSGGVLGAVKDRSDFSLTDVLQEV
jgi:ribose transport system ATP-binding protein